MKINSAQKVRNTTSERKLNRLKDEKSPYLQQHADNPIDWFPWGKEAFSRARAEDKPIFLSLGYSSCHWCHVMEKESFEDSEVADIMNRHYIAIKVDREERPDIDNIYMSACMAMTGSGGWPLTIIMTPDGKPFFAGTYFPKYNYYGRQGLIDILTQIAQLWENDRNRILKSSDKVTEVLKIQSHAMASDSLTTANLEEAVELLGNNFDQVDGGFGSQPKFPSPHNLSFLLRVWKRNGDERALLMAEKTLESMYQGGIFDQLGSGFHRYSTDSRWLAPHFEKMLYDQAMLAIAYTETFQATGKSLYRQAAEDIFTYLLRDMKSPEGAFYSAEDADSEGKEGAFYLWAKSEIESLLGAEEAELICAYYDITEEGNFEGKNIFHINKNADIFAPERGLSVAELRRRIDDAQAKLYRQRENRVHPFKDEKILTDWNGLIIAALAKGAVVFGNSDYLKAAEKTADFILRKMKRKDGRLLHRYMDGEAAISAMIDDYVFLIWGLLELYEAGFKEEYLAEALELSENLKILFYDDKAGGFYFTGSDSEDLLLRTKEIYDGAYPSGNSVAALNYLRLGRLTANMEYESLGRSVIEAFSEAVKRSPVGYTQLLSAADFALGPVKEIIIAGHPQNQNTKLMLEAIRKRFLPRAVLAFNPSNGKNDKLYRLIPYLETQVSSAGNARAFICEDYNCSLPTSDLEKMIEMLN